MSNEVGQVLVRFHSSSIALYQAAVQSRFFGSQNGHHPEIHGISGVKGKHSEGFGTRWRTNSGQEFGQAASGMWSRTKRAAEFPRIASCCARWPSKVTPATTCMQSVMTRPAGDTPEVIKADIFNVWHRSLDARLDLIAPDLQQRKRAGVVPAGAINCALDRLERNARPRDPSDSLSRSSRIRSACLL